SSCRGSHSSAPGPPPASPTRARTFPGSSSASTERAARSVSGAGCAASTWGRAPRIPPSASAVSRSSPGAGAGSSDRARARRAGDHSMSGRIVGAERSRIVRVVAIASVIVVVDQIVKLIALDRLAPGIPVDVVPGPIALPLVRNPGLAFGLLAGIPAGWRWGGGVLSLVALIVLLPRAPRVPPGPATGRLARADRDRSDLRRSRR